MLCLLRSSFHLTTLFSCQDVYKKKTLATAISLGVSICHQKCWQGHGRGRVVDPVKYFRSYSLITMQKSVTVSDTTCVQNTRPSTTHATIPIWSLRVKPYGRRYGGPRIWRKLGPRPQDGGVLTPQNEPLHYTCYLAKSGRSQMVGPQLPQYSGKIVPSHHVVTMDLSCTVSERNGDTGPRKKFDDIFCRLDTIHQRDRQTDRHRLTAKTPLTHNVAP